MKKKFCIYGNCQIYALKACLEQSQDFQEIYEYIPLKPVFQLSSEDVSEIETVISEVDLFIHQPLYQITIRELTA